MKLEERIQQFRETEHDMNIAVSGTLEGCYRPYSIEVQAVRNGDYTTAKEFQELEFISMCNEYKLSHTGLKIEFLKYELKYGMSDK